MVLLNVIKPMSIADVNTTAIAQTSVCTNVKRKMRKLLVSNGVLGQNVRSGYARMNVSGKVSHGYSPLHWLFFGREHHCCTICRYATARTARLMVSEGCIDEDGKRGNGQWNGVTHASAIGTIARPWYASTRKARELTKEYAWRNPESEWACGSESFEVELARERVGWATVM